MAVGHSSINLKGKILLSIVPVILISIMVLGGLAYSLLGKQKEHELVEELGSVSDQVALRDSLFVKTVSTNLNILSNSVYVRNFVSAAGNDLQQKQLLSDLDYALSVFRSRHPKVREIQLFSVDENGSCSAIISRATASIADTASMAMCQDMTHAGLHTHSASAVDENSHESILSFGKRLHAEALTNVSPVKKRNTVDIILVLIIDTATYVESIFKFNPGVGSIESLIDDSGHVAYHPDKQTIGTKLAFGDRLIAEAVVEFNHEKHDDHHGLTKLPGEHGKHTLVHVRKLSNGLNLSLQIPHSEFEVAHRNLIPMLALVTLVTTLFTSLVLWKVLNILILAPIRDLMNTTEAFGNGDYNVGEQTTRNDEIGGLQSAFHDMSVKLSGSMDETRKSHKRIEELAYIDSLTELPNRRWFLDLLEAAIAEADDGTWGKRVAVFFLDIDDFKRINDLMGHEVGNTLLKVVGKRLVASSRLNRCADGQEIDTVVARMGGDEFVVLAAGLTIEDEAIAIAQSMQAALTEKILIDQQQFNISASIGIAMTPEHGTDANAILKCADTAMYEIKLAQKSGYCLFTDEMAERVAEKVQLEYDLRRAIEKKQLYLDYQPQLSTCSNEVLGVEVLLRWNHAERGVIPPQVFIPIAEDFGLIGAIGLWVLDEACSQWKHWRQYGIAPARIAVNVSQRQLSQIDFTTQVGEVLARHDVPASALELEVTESCIMEAPLEIVETIKVLRDKGIRIALDDFGTGYSSLSALALLPIDTIKLDRSFVTDIGKNASNRSIVSAVLKLARDLNLETVAEGIETESERQYLKNELCDVLQGYLLSRPLGSDAATQWLTENTMNSLDESELAPSRLSNFR